MLTADPATLTPEQIKVLVKVRQSQVWGSGIKKHKLDWKFTSEQHKSYLQQYIYSNDPLVRVVYRQAFQLRLVDLPHADRKFQIKNAKFTLPSILDEP